MRAMLALVLLGAVAAAPAGAGGQTLLPLTPPPPDLARLMPFAEAPGEKPPADAAAPPWPTPPNDLPPFPPAAVAAPTADKPTAAVAPPGALPCVGAFFGVASKALECGRARFAKAEYEDAAKALEQAVRDGSESELLLEARYWLAETDYVLGRVERADRLFLQVVQASPKDGGFGVWATHGGAWTGLRLGSALRARDTFAQLLVPGALPTSMEPWARHGLGLASYALGRHEAAVAAWEAMRAQTLPPALARDVTFWLGEALGRVGDADRAATELTQFVQGGAHPLLDQGWLRLGWWGLQAGRSKESADAFRAFLTPASPAAAPRTGSERDWAEAGLALALLPSDAEAARTAARDLETRRSPLVEPLFVRFARTLIQGGHAAEAQGIIQELLAANLTPAARAYALLLQGEASRAQGGLDDARTQYDLAQRAAPGSASGWFAAFRLAQTNVELREFAQAARDLAPLVASASSPDARGAVLLLQGEAAYHAGDQAAASAAFRRVLVELPGHPQAAPAARLGVAWSALRQDRGDDARREFLEFARLYPDNLHTPDALLLASELMLKTPSEWPAARQLLDRIVTEHAARPRMDFAKLNRAILMVKTGGAAGAELELGDWIRRAPFPPLLGRAHTALAVALLAAGKPADAGKAFTLARQEGAGALATLGLGTVQLAQGQWEPAKGLLVDARDNGTAAIAAVAEYGLAVVTYQQGAHGDFKKPALAELGAAPAGRGAPRLLYVLAGLAAEEKDWPAALDRAKRLATDFPGDAAADDAFERVGAGAAAAQAWPVAYEAYTELQQRYPASPFVEPARLTLAEAQVETGRADVARQELEKLVAAAPADAKLTRAWLVLARAREAAGDRAGALEAYTRAARDGRGPEWTPRAVLGNARLLLQDKRWGDARTLLAEPLRSADAATAAEAAFGVAEAWQGEGDQLAAAEYYMTAAYVAPESPLGRKALLGAAASFLAVKQADAAAIVYKKLLDQPGVPADLAEAARKGLRETGR
jgi:tetratricopeptide (TPR) repeat protein